MTHDDAGTSPAGESRRPSFPLGRTASDRLGGSGRQGSGAEPTAARATPTRAPDPEDIVPGRAAAVLGAAASGLAVAVFGTLLHGQILTIAGTQVPVGAVAALLLAGSLFLYCGLWARNVIMTAVAGAVAYGVVALLTTSSKTLIATESEAAPTVALAGNLWLFGVLVVTIVAVAFNGAILRPKRRR